MTSQRALTYQQRRAIRRRCYPVAYALWDGLRVLFVTLAFGCLIGVLLR